MGTTHPYTMLIHNFADCDINFTGTGNRDAGQLTLITPKGVIFNLTGGSGAFNTDDYFNIKAKTVSFPGTFNASFIQNGIIECDVFTVNANSNNPSLEFGYINWKYSLSANEPITYTRCNPMVWKGRVTQAGIADPVVAEVLENRFGETLSLTRTLDGRYTLTSPGGKFNDKMNILFSISEIFAPFSMPIFSWQRDTDNEVTILCWDSVNVLEGDCLGQNTGTVITIEVYP